MAPFHNAYCGHIGNWDLKTDYLKFTPAQFPVRLFQDLENKVLNISF